MELDRQPSPRRTSVGREESTSEVRGRIHRMTPAQLLDFERQHPAATPDKHARIRHELGISEIRYWVLLERAAHHPDGIRAEPVTARLIRERMQQRARIRAQRVA